MVSINFSSVSHAQDDNIIAVEVKHYPVIAHAEPVRANEQIRQFVSIIKRSIFKFKQGFTNAIFGGCVQFLDVLGGSSGVDKLKAQLPKTSSWLLVRLAL